MLSVSHTQEDRKEPMRKELPPPVLLAALCLTVAAPSFAQEITFDKVKIRFQRSDTDRRLVYKDIDLLFNDQSGRMVVRSNDRPLDVAYGGAHKVIFEVTTHMRGGLLGAMIGGAGGAAI